MPRFPCSILHLFGRRAAPLVAGLLVAGCASAPPPAATVVEEAPVAIDAPESIGYEAETGGLPEEAMENAFAAMESPVKRCFASGFERLEQLGGNFKLKLRIGMQGETKWAYLSESTLGDRDTERCILDLARQSSWPRPLGGEGLAEKSFDITPSRDPLEVKAEKVKSAVGKARTQTAKCRRGISGSFVATAYLRPDGRVLSAGVATPSAEAEDVADCVVEAIRKLHFGRPGRAAKVSFEL